MIVLHAMEFDRILTQWLSPTDQHVSSELDEDALIALQESLVHMNLEHESTGSTRVEHSGLTQWRARWRSQIARQLRMAEHGRNTESETFSDGAANEPNDM